MQSHHRALRDRGCAPVGWAAAARRPPSAAAVRCPSAAGAGAQSARVWQTCRLASAPLSSAGLPPARVFEARRWAAGKEEAEEGAGRGPPEAGASPRERYQRGNAAALSGCRGRVARGAGAGGGCGEALPSPGLWSEGTEAEVRVAVGWGSLTAGAWTLVLRPPDSESRSPARWGSAGKE